MSPSQEIPNHIGFDLDDAAGAAMHRDWFDAGDIYHYAAAQFLDSQIEWHMEHRIPQLTAEQGVWHPSGFMVFRLGMHPVLGALRLHVWPEESRQRENRGNGNIEDGLHDGDIHDHDWFVHGLNISGYQDKLFSVDEQKDTAGQKRFFSAEEIAANGLLRQFTATYMGDERMKLETQSVHASGDVTEAGVKHSLGYTATELTHRKLDVRETHAIDPGEFHAPVIPEGSFAATLAFNSRRVTHGGPRILIGGAQNVYVRPRQPVQPDEWQAARSRLLRCAL